MGYLSKEDAELAGIAVGRILFSIKTHIVWMLGVLAASVRDERHWYTF